MNFSMRPSVRLSVGRLAGLSVIISGIGVKFHFHAPIGALVIYSCTQINTFFGKTYVGRDLGQSIHTGFSENIARSLY